MTGTLTRARMAVLGVSEREITAFRQGDSPTWRHLESAVRAAVGGYHAVLEGGGLPDIAARLERFPAPLAGYAHEGVAMGLTGMDCWLPGSSRFQEFLAGPGDAHVYMAHIGAGEALARLRRRPEPFLTRLHDPALRWLVMDGYGFHQGFFSRTRYVGQQLVPRHLSPFARRVFDQGLGRSIWFTAGANVDHIAAHVAAFPPARQPDLWLGVGVASSYVGGVQRHDVERLAEASGPFRASVATGAAFAAKGRHRAGNPIADADLVCDVLCGTSSREAAAIVDDAFASLPARFQQPGYELVQNFMLEAFAASGLPDGHGSARWS